MYSLRKSKHILRDAYSRFKRKSHKIPPDDRTSLLSEMKLLDNAILAKDKYTSSQLAKSIQTKIKHFFPKNIFDQGKELVFALVFALVVATLVRTMWFELYEIPTGSMRPTFKEQDRLIASKTAYGINVPLLAKHFYFQPDLVSRKDIVIFSVENMDVRDPDTLYFFLFPGKRLLIKRCMGLPGDTLYFYGGKLYGIDAKGNELAVLKTMKEETSSIKHVPFITFDGRIKRGDKAGEFFLTQTNQKIAKFTINPFGKISALLFDGKDWIEDDPKALWTPHNKIMTYCDYWGFKNYAMVRILKPEDVEKYTDYPLDKIDKAPLYLEFAHSPSLTYPAPRLMKDEYGRIQPVLTPHTTIIPLQQEHIARLVNNLYTARFIVENERARRYCPTDCDFGPSRYDIPLPGVPNGIYEFYYGQAHKISFGGLSSALEFDHPLYSHKSELLYYLFNAGMELNSAFLPHSKEQVLFPERFAWYEDGNLFVMGTTLYFEDDPTLIRFTSDEQIRQQSSNSKKPYVAFVDRGAPLLPNGSIDQDAINTFGLHVPQKMYYGLGDNYANSADSRDFGFIPEDNIRGRPSWLIWPLGNRLGTPSQPSSPWITIPAITIWGIFILICIVWGMYTRQNFKKPVIKE